MQNFGVSNYKLRSIGPLQDSSLQDLKTGLKVINVSPHRLKHTPSRASLVPVCLSPSADAAYERNFHDGFAFSFRDGMLSKKVLVSQTIDAIPIFENS
jgi:hypothetical protein